MGNVVGKNFAGSQLAFDILSTDLVLTVSDGSVFPQAPVEGDFVLVVEDVDANKEIMRCTSRSNETLSVTRAQEGTTALAFAAGSSVEMRYTIGFLDEYFSAQGLDSGYWVEGSGQTNRKTIQIIRNMEEPAQAPTHLYEGELALQGATSTPLLYVGPEGAGSGENEGSAGIPILPIVVSSIEPANPYGGLLWANTGAPGHSTFPELNVYVPWENAFYPVYTGSEDSKAYVDALIEELRNTLSAPANTKMVFRTSSPPTGWAIDTSSHDRMLRVINGGSIGSGGTWNLKDYLWVGSHALTLNEIPSHDHGGGNHIHTGGVLNVGGVKNVGFGNSHGQPLNMGDSGRTVEYQGGNAAHSHLYNFNNTWRPLYADVIVAYKLSGS